MVQKRNTIFQAIFGNPEDHTLEDQIPIVLSFATATLSLVAMTLNIILGLSLLMIIIPLGASAAMFFVYYKLLKSSNKYFYNVLMALVAFAYFNFLWYNNYASYGPALYLFLLFFIFVIMIFDGKSRLFFAGLVFLNILALFFVEHFAKNLILHYSDDETRMIDIYFSLIIYLVFTLIMSLVIRYYYLLERSKAKQSDELKSAFLSNMSHEIRTPMNAILGFGMLLEDAKSETERSEYVNIINVNGKMLMDLIDDILDISKMDAGQFEIYTRPFLLNSVMQDLEKVIRLYLDQLGKKDVALTMNAEPGIVWLNSDENRMRQVLYNFLTNASKFTLKGGITFGYRVRSKDVEFFVSDTGIGIKEEFLKDIFNRFYKIKNVDYTTIPRGSGIGLSISRVIVEKLGGVISFDSVYGRGSTFSFTLPSVVVESIPEPEIKIKTDAVSALSGTVLLTEDDPGNMLLLTTLLKKHGVAYKMAFNGAEAIEVYKKHTDINLVLMDVYLPVMDGFEALHKLKLLNQGLPVVALSAHAMHADKEKALAAGFDGYITKPIDQDELLDYLKKYLVC